MSFSNYKKLKENLNNNAKKQIESETQSTGYETDPDDWYPDVDKKTGQGLALIRFLPPLESDPELSYVQWHYYSFKNAQTGKWYINNSLKKSKFDSTPDPVAQFNKKLWNSSTNTDDAAHKQAKDQKLKTQYRANIYVISDSINPENNGKVKKFKFGKYFADMIKAAIEPENKLDQEPPVPIFDLFDGANLKISIFTEKRGEKDQRNYTKSKWMNPGPLSNDEALLESIYNEINSDKKWSLKQYIEPSMFKTYDELKKRLDEVLGFDSVTNKPLIETTSSSPETKPSEGNQTPERNQNLVEDEDEAFKRLMADDD